MYTLIGFLVLPFVSMKMLPQKLEQSLNRSVSIEKISINPYTLTIGVEGFLIKDKDSSTFAAFDRLFVNASLSSLFTLTPQVSRLTLENPDLNIIRYPSNRFNFSDMIARGKTRVPGQENDSPEQPEKKMPKFVLNSLTVIGGKITFEDQVIGASHQLEQLSLSLPFISSRPKDSGQAVSLDMSGMLNHTQLGIKLETTPFTDDLASQFELKTGDIDLLHYLGYAPIPQGLDVKGLDLNLHLYGSYLSSVAGSDFDLQGKVNFLNAAVNGRNSEPLAGFKKLAVTLAPSEILKGQVNLSQILLAKPMLNLKRDTQGQLDLVSYFPQKKQADRGNESSPTAFVVTLDSGVIQDAAIDFEDHSTDYPFKTRVSPLNLSIKDLRADKSVQGKYTIDLATEKKESLSCDGQFSLNPLSVEGALKLSNIAIEKYTPYYGPYLGVDILNGSLSLNTAVTAGKAIDQENVDYQIKVEDFSVNSLIVADRTTSQEMIKLPEFGISKAVIDSKIRQISTGSIRAKHGKILLKRLQDGRINLAASATQKSEQNQSVKNEPKGKEPNQPWQIILNDFNAQEFAVDFHDLTPKEPVAISLSKINVAAENMKTFGKDAGTLNVGINWNQGGKIKVQGTALPAKRWADLDIVLEGIDIESLQPYFTEQVKIMVTSGNINTKGNIQLNLADASDTRFHFTGKTSVTDFISLDKASAKDFFKCKSLYLSDADISVFPVSVAIKDIALTDFYSRIIVNDTGHLNLTDVFASAPDTQTPVETREEDQGVPPEPARIQVDNVTLQAGHVAFSDYLTKPNFTAGMKQITGSVKGLSSRQETRAKLHLKGLHGNSSPLDIVGDINPLAKKKYADIDISFKDIELTNFTPYSAKYLGYKIEKGKLILDLHYTIDGEKLRSANKVRFDNFTLGEAVASEHATSLPVGLAVSLLKNRSGQIDLDLPVTGELDDPEFKIGSIVLKMITNLIMKVVTSPFAIVGSMFGGDEDLGFVEYSHGLAELDEANLEKLDTLGQILVEKPGVKLEIQGGYHLVKDTQTLKRMAFEELLKAQKLKQLIASGVDANNLEDITVLAEEEAVYVQAAFDQAQFPMPRDASGAVKQLELDEKKKLLITNINIGNDELRLLAMRRSESVKDYLISTAGVDRERIFLIEPRANEEAEDAQDKTKVLFLLK